MEALVVKVEMAVEVKAEYEMEVAVRVKSASVVSAVELNQGCH